MRRRDVGRDSRISTLVELNRMTSASIRQNARQEHVDALRKTHQGAFPDHTTPLRSSVPEKLISVAAVSIRSSWSSCA